MLEEIKTIEGVEDAWINDPTTLWIKIEGFGKIAYFYPPKETCPLDSIISLLSFNSIEKIPMTKSADSQICENSNVCIINQQSEDPDRDFFKPIYKDLAQSFRNQNFQVTEIENTSAQNSRHIVIYAQSEYYDELGYFKAKLREDGILANVVSTQGEKQGNLVKIVIEGDLP